MVIEHGVLARTSGPSAEDGIHVIHNYAFNDEATMALEIVSANDVGKIAQRTDQKAFYIARETGTGFEFWSRIDKAEATVHSFPQTAHGLVELEAVYFDAGYQKALSNDQTKQAFGIVSEATTSNIVEVTTNGIMVSPAHGFTPNALLYTSTTAGVLVETRPTVSGQFQNPVARVLDANTLFVLPWKQEQDPEIANRMVLLSPTVATDVSTTHALQIGADGAARTHISANEMVALDAGGGPEEFGINGSRIRLTGSEGGSVLRLVRPLTSTLADSIPLNVRLITNDGGGDIEHGRMGGLGNDGLGFDNKSTNTLGKNILLKSEGGTVKVRSNATIPIQLRNDDTITIGTPYESVIQWVTSAGGVIHATIGKDGTTGEFGIKTLSTLTDATRDIVMSPGANFFGKFVVQSNGDTAILWRKTTAIPLSTDHIQLMEFQTDSGAILHARFGFSSGFIIENFKTSLTSRDILLVATPDATAFIKIDGADPLILQSSISAAVSVDFDQKISYQSNAGGVTHGTVGYNATTGLTFQSFKTGTDNRNANFVFADTEAAVLSQRFIATSNTSASLSSTLHGLQVGDGTGQHLKFGGIVIEALNGTPAPTSLDLNCLRVRINTDNSAIMHFRNPNTIALSDNYTGRLVFFSDVGGVNRGQLGFSGALGFEFINNQTGAGRNGYLFSMAEADATVLSQRFTATSATVATDGTSTDHAFQVGADGASRTVYSPNSIVALAAGGTIDELLIHTTGLHVVTDNVVPVVLDSPTVVALADNFSQEIRFRSDGGTLVHGGIGFNGSSGLRLDNRKTGVGNRDITLRTAGGTTILETTNDFALNLLTPTVVGLGAGHTQRIQYQTGGGVVHAQIGFEGQFVIRNNKTGAFLRDITFGLAEAAATVQSQRFTATSSIIPTLTSTEHALQVGLSSSFHTKIGVNTIKAVNSTDTEANLAIEASVINLASTSFTAVQSANTVPLRLQSPTTVALGSNLSQILRYDTDAGAVTHGEIGFNGQAGLRFLNNKTGGTRNDMTFEMTGSLNVNSAHDPWLIHNDPTTVAIDAQYDSIIEWKTDGGSLSRGSFGFGSNDGLLIRNLQTGGQTSLITLSNTNADTTGVLKLKQTGTGGAESKITVGNSDPSGRVNASAGALFILVNGSSSNLFVSTGGTNWTGLK